MVLRGATGEVARGDEPARHLAALWFGLLGPPVIWATRLAANYILVPYACGTGSTLLLHLPTLAALLATAAAGWISLGRWREPRPDAGARPARRVERARFMAMAGLLSSGFFFIVMVAEWLPVFFVDPCHEAGVPLA